MRTLPGLLVSVSLVVVGVAATPSAACAQTLRTVGGFVGRTDSWQQWLEHPDDRHKHGIEVGAFVDTQTPAPWLSVSAEAAYIQLGARLPLGSGGAGAPLLADVRAEYLTAAVLPTARLSWGALSVYGYAGPGLQIHVRTRSAQELSLAYQNYKAEVLVGQAGVGVGIRLAERWSLRAEIRRSADVTPAYTSAPGDIRFRSQEILLRLGVRTRHPLP